MTHVGTKTIETERLILRKFTLDDADMAYKNWMGDSEVTKHLRWQAHADVSVTRETIAEFVRSYDDQTYYNWAITMKDSGEVIGFIGCAWMDERIHMIHTFYCIGKAWWGGGIVTEAYKAVLRYFFKEVGAYRIEAYHAPENPASGKVMQKCGLTCEGTLRRADISNMGIVDAVVYGILKEEYFADK